MLRRRRRRKDTTTTTTADLFVMETDDDEDDRKRRRRRRGRDKGHVRTAVRRPRVELTQAMGRQLVTWSLFMIFEILKCLSLELCGIFYIWIYLVLYT